MTSSTPDLAATLASADLTDEVRRNAHRWFSNCPARTTSTSSNRFFFFSKKNGRQMLLQGTTAFLSAHELENNPEVLCFDAEAPSVTLVYHQLDAEGKPLAKPTCPRHFADLVVLEKRRVLLEETKPWKKLSELAKEDPARYIFNPALGSFASPPAEQAARQLGFGYRIRTDKDFSPAEISNLFALLPLAVHEPNPETTAAFNELRQSVSGNEGIDIAALAALTKIEPAQIRSAVARGFLYSDLQVQGFVHNDGARIFSDRIVADFIFRIERSTHKDSTDHPFALSLDVGEVLIIDGNRHEITHRGDKLIVTETDQSKRTQAFRIDHLHASAARGRVTPLGKSGGRADTAFKAIPGLPPMKRREVLEAQRRLTIIAPHIGRKPRDRAALGIPKLNRSGFRYLANYRLAEELYGCGFLGLLPRYCDRGPQKSTLEEIRRQPAVEAIRKYYLSTEAPDVSFAYGKYRADLDQNEPHLIVCRETFSKLIDEVSAVVKARERLGDGAVGSCEPPRFGEFCNLFGQAAFPFHVVYIDHTKSRHATIHPITGKSLGTSWTVTLVDGYSRKWLLSFVTYLPPSETTVYIAMRLLLQRYGFAPAIISLDNAGEFRSDSFILLGGALRMTIVYHRARRPKASTLVERRHGIQKQQLSANLPGSTKIEALGIDIVPEVDPHKLATLTLPDYQVALDSFAEHFNKRENAAIGTSPNEMFERGLPRATNALKRYEDCPLTHFLLLPAPQNSGGTAKVQANKGVQFGGICYWNPAFESDLVVGRRVPVRYDPLNVLIAWIYLNRKWRPCWALGLDSLMHLDGASLMAASFLIRRRMALHRAGYDDRCAQLARALAEIAAGIQPRVEHVEDLGKIIISFNAVAKVLANPGSLSQAAKLLGPSGDGIEGPTPALLPPKPPTAKKPEKPALTLELLAPDAPVLDEERTLDAQDHDKSIKEYGA